MIQKELLAQLGWSEDLIAEVVRSATVIERDYPNVSTIRNACAEEDTYVSNSIYFSSEQIDTGDQLLID